jgi:hypothetical protein
MNSKATKTKRVFSGITVLFSLLALAGSSFAGIEEHSPNPGPDFEEWEVISIDLERAREEAENEQEVEEGVDESINNIFGGAPMNQSQKAFYRNLQIKWELAPYGLDWVPPSESDLLEGLVPSTLDAPEGVTDSDSPEETSEANERKEENEEDLSELDGRLLTDEESESMTGCNAAEYGRSSLPIFLTFFLLSWLVLRHYHRFFQAYKIRS